MKIDFSNFNSDFVRDGAVFFLFGNFKRSFEVFCEFVISKIRAKFETSGLNIHYCALQDASKILQNRCDLFGNDFDVFCIRGIEDQHLSKLTSLFSEHNCIFILEAGDFRKSKEATDFFRENKNTFAIASFLNDIGLMSLCKMLLPRGTSTAVCRKVAELMSNTDESLISFFKKINLLIESTESNDINNVLQKYTTYKMSFIQKMDFIPLLKYLQKLAVKEKICLKKAQFYDMNLSRNGVLEEFIKYEINYKLGIQLPKSLLM